RQASQEPSARRDAGDLVESSSRLLHEIFSAFDDDPALILGHDQFRGRYLIQQFRRQNFIERLPLLYGRKAQAQRFTQALATLGGQATELFDRTGRHDPAADYAAFAAPTDVEPPRDAQTAQARCWMKQFRHLHIFDWGLIAKAPRTPRGSHISPG